MIKDSDLTGKKLADLIKELTEHPERIKQMEEASAMMARKNAGEKIVDHCLELI